MHKKMVLVCANGQSVFLYSSIDRWYYTLIARVFIQKTCPSLLISFHDVCAPFRGIALSVVGASLTSMMLG